ncbi:undecaprenyl/decaprenyl-phosphate alpha-N-acetylglucosaminyl 1-phosphate transferase [Patescibacteria group bacterium]|nr:undecaprenyl/decaprenyl-phosphate alpha-N-acetylglucosaminyl 1-phosphate transferase [Patescibacteria group bacterium]MBU1028994.1 undecaprenyl/decaprenyl-phosphate alpha-N-acetylglucosaminyl 1-phosphate transferase [Patescibacteria group bacterium]
MTFFIIFIGAFGLSILTTVFVRGLARHFGVLAEPGGRRLHKKAVPLLGGVALFIALVLIVVVLTSFGWLPGSHIKAKYLVGIIAAAGLLSFGGALDDRYELKPWQQFIWPFLAVLAVIVVGIGVNYITNPFGGLIELNKYIMTAVWIDGIPYKLTILADIFTLAWLMTMTYTTKFLDGLDGLVVGLTVIGGLVIAAVSLMREVAQPDTAILALAIAGVFAGFLVFNIYPARIFLGEGGSTLAGFLLGILAIISGGKIATTLLVLGLPLFDAAIVIIRRLVRGKSPFGGDRSHLHFLLVDSGLPQRSVVLLYWFLAALFGISTLILPGPQKVTAIGVALSLLLVILAGALIMQKRNSIK